MEFYKRSQIKKLDGEEEKIFTGKEKTKDNKQIIASLPNAVKLKIKNNIKKKKTEVKKLKEIYSDPKSIPSEVKNQVSKQIEDTKDGLKNLIDYNGKPDYTYNLKSNSNYPINYLLTYL